MPNVADYSILADNWWTEGHSKPDPLTFTVPENMVPSRTILSFMLDTWNEDDMHLTLRMNGTEVWSWKYEAGERLMHFQEVMAKGVVTAGVNRLSIDSSSGDFRSVRVSDVVVFWQAAV